MRLVNGLYHNTPLNTSEMPQDALNIEDKTRSNPLPWSGQFSPQLANGLLRKYAEPETVILDPFVGSGTVLLEAGRLGLKAFGSDINPAAVAMSKVYQFINLLLSERQLCLARTNDALEKRLQVISPPLGTPEELKYKLVDLASCGENYSNVLAELLVVVADFYKPGLSINRIFEVWRKIASLIIGLPHSNRPIRACNADVRNLPLDNSSIDLVLTSPPYINVFNYHQRFRASMEALRWDLLRVAKSEFGANRKHRGNRFLTVIQFCLDISQALDELKRVCSDDARLIFIVGRESTVCGTRFFNGEIVTEIAHKALGFELSLRQERVFLNRYGQRIYEDILHFSPRSGRAHNCRLKEAREVARQVLEAAYDTGPPGSTDGLKAALASIEKVSPSPVFDACESFGSDIAVNGDIVQGRLENV